MPLFRPYSLVDFIQYFQFTNAVAAERNYVLKFLLIQRKISISLSPSIELCSEKSMYMYVVQRRRIVQKFGGISSNMVGKICLPGSNRVKGQLPPPTSYTGIPVKCSSTAV